MPAIAPCYCIRILNGTPSLAGRKSRPDRGRTEAGRMSGRKGSVVRDEMPCRIEYGEEEGDSGQPVATTTATCTGCGAETFSYGDGDASVRRCLMLMKDECCCIGEYWFVPEE